MASTKDGRSKTRLYHIWVYMRKRCNNPNDDAYERYGGRGIRVCDEWNMSFDSFKEWAEKSGYADDLTIERLDVNGNYQPDNCTWITRAEQAKNRRSSNMLTINGITKTAADWSRDAGFEKHVVMDRIRKGMDLEEAISRPSRQKKQYTVNGEVGTISEIASRHGLDRNTLASRIRRGLTGDALFAPAQRK